jgi:uncharacterized protein YbjT (DUF2867 family)
MARVLIVGCGCRGRALAGALAAEGLAVRGTTRRVELVDELMAAGVEPAVADPQRLATLVPHLAGVSVVCWLLGSAAGPAVADLHGARLESLLAHVVDTPVRGLVYEAAGAAPEPLLAVGEGLVRAAAERWRLPVAVVHDDPGEHGRWLAAMTRAVGDLLAGGAPGA